MLIRFKKSFEKIAMGLMSFMPGEKEIKKLQHTIKQYESDENWQLYLWKKEDIIGLVGVIIDEDQIQVQHISVNPSHRGEGIGRSMMLALKKIYEDKHLIPNHETATFFAKCLELDKEDEQKSDETIPE